MPKIKKELSSDRLSALVTRLQLAEEERTKAIIAASAADNEIRDVRIALAEAIGLEPLVTKRKKPGPKPGKKRGRPRKAKRGRPRVKRAG